jgi:hypothetical protein
MRLRVTTVLLALFTAVGLAGAGFVDTAAYANSGGPTRLLGDEPLTGQAGQSPQQMASADVPVAPHNLNAMCCGDGCNPNRTDDFEWHRWDGWKHNVGGFVIGGAQGDIWNYSPWVAPVGGYHLNFVTSWAMITTDHPYGVDAGYAQVGWIEFSGGERDTYVQEHDYGGGRRTILYSPQGVNTYTYYDVFYDPNSNSVTFQVAGSGLGETYHPSNWKPGEAQVSGETLSLADQMPGGHGSASNYEDLFWSEYYYNGAWQYFNPGAQFFIADQNGTDQSPYFGEYTWNSRSISIYDKACNQ